MSTTNKIALLAISITIILWLLDRFVPRKPKYSINELEEIFKKIGPINNQVDIKGDNNTVILDNKKNNE